MKYIFRIKAGWRIFFMASTDLFIANINSAKKRCLRWAEWFLWRVEKHVPKVFENPFKVLELI